MSKKETTYKDSENIFSAYQDSIDSLINGIKRTVPHYHQSITNVQQEYLRAYENVFDASISMQKDCVEKTGISASIPKTTSKMIRYNTNELAKASSIHNQMILATIDTAQQNIKIFNDNTESFVEMSKKVLQSWISTCTTNRIN